MLFLVKTIFLPFFHFLVVQFFDWGWGPWASVFLHSIICGCLPCSGLVYLAILWDILGIISPVLLGRTILQQLPILVALIISQPLSLGCRSCVVGASAGNRLHNCISIIVVFCSGLHLLHREVLGERRAVIYHCKLIVHVRCLQPYKSKRRFWFWCFS